MPSIPKKRGKPLFSKDLPRYYKITFSQFTPLQQPIRHYSHKLILEYKNTIGDTALQVKLNDLPDGCDQ